MARHTQDTTAHEARATTSVASIDAARPSTLRPLLAAPRGRTISGRAMGAGWVGLAVLTMLGCAGQSVPPPGDASVRLVGQGGATAAVVLPDASAPEPDPYAIVGRGSAVVFGGSTETDPVTGPTNPWTARRDASLGVASGEGFETLGVWPSEVRASLREQRRIYFPRNADTYLYFETPRVYPRGHTHRRPTGRYTPRGLAW